MKTLMIHTWLWMVVFLAAAEASAGAAAVNVAMAPDGRSITFQAPCLTGFKGGFSATIISGGETQKLSSALGTVVGTPERTTEVTPYGTATVTAVTIQFEKEQIDLLFRLGQVPGVPGFQAQAGIRNIGKIPVRLVSVTPLAFEGRVNGSPAEWLVTALDISVKSNPLPVVALGEIKEPLSVYEYGGFYRADGTGFLFGPVGAPIASVAAIVAHGDGGKVSFMYTADMSGVLVDPGETRWGQQVALLTEPPQKALVRWSEWVAKTHGARANKGAMSGWNNYNALTKKDISKELLDVTDMVLNSGGRLRPSVIQIDIDEKNDHLGLKTIDAPWVSSCARRIRESGARFGLRLEFVMKMDRRGIDPQIEITNTVRRAVQNGFSYIKIIYFPPPLGALVSGEKRTAFDAVCSSAIVTRTFLSPTAPA